MWNMRLASLIQLAALGLLGTFETVRMKDQGLPEAQIGIILAIESGLMMFTALAWGRWADHTQHFKRGISISTVGLMLTLAWFSRAETFGDFVIYGLLRGLFMTGIVGLMPALALANLNPDSPGKGFGGYRRYGSIGFLFAASIMPLLFAEITTMAMAAMVYVPISLWFVHGLKDPVAHAVSDVPDAKLSAIPGLGFLLAALFLANMSEPGVHGFFNTYARDLGASVEWVGLVSGLTGVIALLSLGYMGRLADRIGAARLLVYGFIAQGLRMLTTSFVTDADWMWVPHLFHGFGWAGREVATLLLLTTLLGKQRRGLASSLLISLRMGGMMAGSLLMGWLAEHQGYPVMFQIISGCVGLGLVFLWLGLRRSKLAASRS